jgi:23S rRNA (uracil1939-C5)-methyltransferase
MKLRIEKAVYGGSGLARIDAPGGPRDGKTVFTPLTLPGELVEAHVAADRRGFLEAELDAVLESSPVRTTPTCPYFGTCGGCNYQHAVYPNQLEIKTAILRETLERARIAELPPIHTVSGAPWRYRNRIRLQIQANPFALGYRERRSHRVLPVAQCPIAAPMLEKATISVTEAGEALDLAAFANEIELFTDAEEATLLATFLAEKAPPQPKARLHQICQALKRQIPQLAGAALVAPQGKQPPRRFATWGETSLHYQTAGFPYQVGLGAFFQVNRFLTDALVELVSGNRTGRLAWDLYAGVGLFARALTRGFDRVIAVESSPEAVANLRQNLGEGREVVPHRAIEATTLDFLRKQNPAKTPPDLVVVDPPRSGLGAPITDLLARLGPAGIVYVSCDPATLSRDLAALVQSGYDLQTITMVDMFPQTFHLESVSALARR